MKLGLAVHMAIGPPTVRTYLEQLVAKDDCRVGVDVGCGTSSALTPFRPTLVTVGIDAFASAIEEARRSNAHDHYIVADVQSSAVPDLLKECGVCEVDLITLIQTIEHLPKHEGYDLLRRCEALTSKYVLVETPNGFREQGPEFGNEFQRHLSGWLSADFEGLGYQVHGSTGTRYLRGYASGPRWNFKGCPSLDLVLARLLAIGRYPRHAYNLVAIKDVRGVPARLHAGSAG